MICQKFNISIFTLHFQSSYSAKKPTINMNPMIEAIKT